MSNIGVLPKEILYYGEKELHFINNVKRMTPHTGLQDWEMCDLICTNLRILYKPILNMPNINKNSNSCSKNMLLSSYIGLSATHNLYINNKANPIYNPFKAKLFKNAEEQEIDKINTDKKSWLKTSNNVQPFIFYSNVDYYSYCLNSKVKPLAIASKKLYPGMYLLKKDKEDGNFCPDGMYLHIFCKNLRVETFLLINSHYSNKFGNTKMQHFDIFFNTILTCTTQSKLKLYKHFASQSIIDIHDNTPDTINKSKDQLTSIMKHNNRFTIFLKNKACKDIQFFLISKDWLAELERNGVKSGWRITLVNECFHLSPTLPRIFVVPASHLDSTLKSASFYFSHDKGRIPFWSWASRYGCTLMRSSIARKRHRLKEAHILSNRFLFGPHHKLHHSQIKGQSVNNVNDEDLDYKLVETLRQLHPNRKIPIIINIDYELFGDRRNRPLNKKGSKSRTGSVEDLTKPNKGENYLNSTPGINRVNLSFRALKKLIREKSNAFKSHKTDDQRNYLKRGSHVIVPNRNTLSKLTSSHFGTFSQASLKDEAHIFIDNSDSGSCPSYLSANNKSVTCQKGYNLKTTYVPKFNNDSVKSTFARSATKSSSNSLTSQNKRGNDTYSRHHENWLSSYESTGWGQLVRSCIQTASTVAYHMMVDQFSVILVEQDSTLFSPLVSSLAILLMDPHSRTLSGFNSLIQREWIIMGHPFRFLYGIQDSLLDGAENGIQTRSSKKPRHVPIFHLFLECVWQISLQYPSSFEFSEPYLIYLSDSCYSPTNDSFTFNNMHERFKFYSALMSESEMLPSNTNRPKEVYKSATTTKTTSFNEALEKDQNLLCMINSVWNYWDIECKDVDNSESYYDIPSNFLNPWYLSFKTFSFPSSRLNSSNSLNTYKKCLTKTLSTNSHYLMPKISPPLMVFWSNYYFRWTDNVYHHDYYISPLSGIELLSRCMRIVIDNLANLSLKRDTMEKLLEKSQNDFKN